MTTSVEQALDAISYHAARISSSLEYIGTAGIEERLDATNRALWAINKTLQQLVSAAASSTKTCEDNDVKDEGLTP